MQHLTLCHSGVQQAQIALPPQVWSLWLQPRAPGHCGQLHSEGQSPLPCSSPGIKFQLMRCRGLHHRPLLSALGHKAQAHADKSLCIAIRRADNGRAEGTCLRAAT